MKSKKPKTSQEAIDAFNAPFHNIISGVLDPVFSTLNRNSSKNIEDCLPEIGAHLSQFTNPTKKAL